MLVPVVAPVVVVVVVVASVVPWAVPSSSVGWDVVGWLVADCVVSWAATGPAISAAKAAAVIRRVTFISFPLEVFPPAEAREC